MKTFISKLIVLADKLDGLGFKKDADCVDSLISTSARQRDAEDFDALTKLFDETLEFESGEDDGPVVRREPNVSEEDLAGFTEVEPGESTETHQSNRLDEIRRRHQLLKLKRDLEKLDVSDEVEEVAEPNALPVAETDKAFEDEDEADDGLLDELKDKLKSAPTLAGQLLALIRENPELLELLAL